jgi:ATP-binding protein involved in chromosome partitioning
MNGGPIEHIPSLQVSPAESVTAEPGEDCGRGHACSFCPLETSCTLDKDQHSRSHIEQRLAKMNWIIPVLANKGGV